MFASFQIDWNIVALLIACAIVGFAAIGCVRICNRIADDVNAYYFPNG